MMAVADGNAFRSTRCRRRAVYTVEHERHYAGLARAVPISGARHIAHDFGGVGQQLLLCTDRSGETNHVCNRARAKSDRAGNVRDAGLELVRQLVSRRALERDGADHVPAAHERRQLFEE